MADTFPAMIVTAQPSQTVTYDAMAAGGHDMAPPWYAYFRATEGSLTVYALLRPAQNRRPPDVLRRRAKDAV